MSKSTAVLIMLSAALLFYRFYVALTVQQTLVHPSPPPTIAGFTYGSTFETFGQQWIVKSLATDQHGVRISYKYEPVQEMVDPRDADHRLLVTFNSNPDHVKQKYFIEQRRIGGNWIWDGIFRLVSNDGVTSESVYKQGVVHGLERAYYANGQIKMEAEYRDDKRNGLARGWDEHGDLQYESVYANDVEVSGQSFTSTK
jgi:hypothetical protein